MGRGEVAAIIDALPRRRRQAGVDLRGGSDRVVAAPRRDGPSTPDARAADRPKGPTDYAGPTMSKKTNKRKMKARRKKANHGKRPNAGR